MSTVHPDPSVIWFAGMGFRPAVWTASHRHDEVDPPRLVPAPDADIPMLAKWEAPADTSAAPASAYTWGTWLPAPVADAPQITAASLAGPVAGPQPYGPWHPVTPSQPWWPSEPNWPDYPCNCITPDSPDMPPIAPVPVSASAGSMLAVALIGSAFCGWMARRRK